MTGIGRVPRRDALRTLAAIGTGTALGGDALATSFESSTFDTGPTLASETIRQSMTHEETDEHYVATDGVSQSDLSLVGPDDEWRERCGDAGPGVVHRFTVAGFYRNDLEPRVEVSLRDGRGCGNASVTPHAGFVASADDNRSDEELEDAALEHYLDDPGDVSRELRSEAEAAATFDFESVEYGVALTLGLFMVARVHPLVGGALAAGQLLAMFLESDPESFDRYANDAFELKPDPERDLNVVLADFSVVVPSGESATVDVDFEHGLLGFSDDHPTAEWFQDRTFEIAVPANDVEHSITDDAVEAATITPDPAPITSTAEDDRTRDLQAMQPSTGFGSSGRHDWQVLPMDAVDELVTDGSSAQLSVSRDGLYPVKYEFSEDSILDFGEDPHRTYTAERAIQFGDLPELVSLDGPALRVIAPAMVHPAQTPTFEGVVVTPGTVEEIGWALSERQVGTNPGEFGWSRVDGEVSTRSSPPAYQPDVDYEPGDYQVRLRVTDDQDDTEQIHGFRVTEDAPYQLTVSIDGPDEVPVNEPATFEVSTDQNAAVESVDWDGVDGSDDSVEHAFETEGTATVAATVTDEYGETATATMEVDVLEAIDVTTAFPDEAWVGETRSYDLVVEGSLEPVDVKWQAVLSTRTYPEQLDQYDGQTSIEHAFPNDRVDRLQATVEFPSGRRIVADESVSVDEAPETTVEVDPSELTLGVGESEHLSMSEETPDRVSVESRRWDDGANFGPWYSVSYDTVGEKEAVAEVEDSLGRTTYETVPVEVEAVDPSVSITFPGNDSPIQSEQIWIHAEADSPNGDVVEYDWEHAYGADAGYTSISKSGAKIMYSDEETGTRSIKVTVTDEVGVEASDRVAINVSPADVSASIDVLSAEDEAVTVAADYEADLFVEAIDWFFEGSRQRDPDHTEENFGSPVTYENTGLYKVDIHLTVTDRLGNTDVDTLTEVDTY